MPEYATVEFPEGDQPDRRFERIIGKSAALESVLDQVEQVAPTDSTVLIEGETGTGKELIAHAIHNASHRCGRTFIKLNCAAIPLDLLESEVFGHEKGAFTGAIAQKIGRFEMADKGTLFLDEVGDIPPALQPKLLRVLQEQEFERLGSGRTHKVDVRLVAATNRSLVKMVARGQFRSDLYYRLNVFPLLLPALRERREDIPALVTHFVKLFSRRMGKQVDSIPPETMAAFQWYSWPGNIRELQNLVERAVILSRDDVLPNPLHNNQTELMIPSLQRTRTFHPSMAFEDSDRALIVDTLEQAGWIVGGPRGAAGKLGLKRTTLLAKMKRLPLLKDGSSIVLCASVVATKGLPSNSVYSATKAAVRSFARTWATDLRSRRIRVNAVSPGSTDTPGLSELLGSSETGQQRLKMISNVVPLGRLGKPDEIAKAVVFLASDDASYVTGAELFVDGGFAQV